MRELLPRQGFGAEQAHRMNAASVDRRLVRRASRQFRGPDDSGVEPEGLG